MRLWLSNICADSVVSMMISSVCASLSHVYLVWHSVTMRECLVTGIEGQTSTGLGPNQGEASLGPDQGEASLGPDQGEASLRPNQGLYVGDPHNVPNTQNLDRMNSMQQQVRIALLIDYIPLHPLTSTTLACHAPCCPWSLRAPSSPSLSITTLHPSRTLLAGSTPPAAPPPWPYKPFTEHAPPFLSK